ncbi:MAG TPA: Gfo/Idh/MocA family oxidoreductase [Alphaproteobacteria bacterium]|nr:Gfo/Idh/MocA family oxidoreductase [Alphaproteobacteria bacterium]
MPYRIGIIGAGIMGRRMADRVAAHERFNLVAAWDPDAEAIAQLRKAHPSTAVAADAAALCARDDIDCVYIAAPPAHHAAHAHAAFDRGKAMFCEKPLTVDDAEGEALVARAERERRKAGVNFSLAGAPSFRKIVDTIATGVLGPILRIDIFVRFRRWPRGWQDGASSWVSGRREGGFTREVVSHFIFTTQRLVGAVEVLRSRVERPDPAQAETTVAAEMRANDAVVTLDGRVAGEADDHNLWTVTCARGALRIRDWHGLERRDGETWYEMETSSVDEMRVVAGRAQLDDLASLLDGKPHALPSLREGLHVQRTIEALLRGNE